MPKHDVYIEAFLGSGSIMRRKKPAKENIGIDIDAGAIVEFDKRIHDCNMLLLIGDSVKLLASSELTMRPGLLIYCDPPYLLSTRASKNRIYKHEMMSEAEHARLLEVLLSLNCMVMISGYDSTLYNSMLMSWRKAEFPTINRANKRVIECVWMNFDEPLELHDSRFLGKNFTDRQRIKRKRERIKQKLLRLPALERQVLFEAIDELRYREDESIYARA